MNELDNFRLDNFAVIKEDVVDTRRYVLAPVRTRLGGWIMARVDDTPFSAEESEIPTLSYDEEAEVAFSIPKKPA